MKRILIVIILVFSCISKIVFATDYSSHWAYENIVRGVNNENISCYPDGRFLPNSNVRANEFLKMLIKCNESQMIDGIEFWDKPYIKYAYDNGYVVDKTTKFDEYITRREVFQILYRYIQENVDNTEYSNAENVFTDYIGDSIEINYLISKNLIKGFSDNTLKLNNYITRGEAISIIYRVYDYLNEKIYSNNMDKNIFNSKDIHEYMNYTDNGIFLNDFKLENDILKYRDKGRVDRYDYISIDQKRSEMVSNIILKLSNRGNYIVNTIYRNDNSLHVFYGEKAGYMNNGSYILEVVIYEEGNEYVAKIEIYKLWKELNEIRNNVLVNKYYENKLKSVLEIWLSKNECEKIVNSIKNGNNINESKYILERNGFRNTVYLKS